MNNPVLSKASDVGTSATYKLKGLMVEVTLQYFNHLT